MILAILGINPAFPSALPPMQLFHSMRPWSFLEFCAVIRSQVMEVPFSDHYDSCSDSAPIILGIFPLCFPSFCFVCFCKVKKRRKDLNKSIIIFIWKFLIQFNPNMNMRFTGDEGKASLGYSGGVMMAIVIPSTICFLHKKTKNRQRWR